MVWYCHHFKNFPQIAVYTVKGFSFINEQMFSSGILFYNDPEDIGNLISNSSAFSKSCLYIWKFLVHILLKPSLTDFEYYLASI